MSLGRTSRETDFPPDKFLLLFSPDLKGSQTQQDLQGSFEDERQDPSTN